MKDNKAAGLEGLRSEQIKHFGPRAQAWILDLMNNCIEKMQIPRMWRKSCVVALLKPGKELNEAKDLRPVSLSYATYSKLCSELSLIAYRPMQMKP